ncbi:hypothetical protein C0J52_03366, partial [Blattella germanica]
RATSSVAFGEVTDCRESIYQKIGYVSANYSLFSDYKCYFIFHGCLPTLHIEATALLFAKRNVSQECENTGIAAFKKTGLDFNRMAKDPYHSIVLEDF